MRAAVFDLDGTLLRGTSAERVLLPWLVRREVVGLRPLLAALARAATLPILGRTRALRRNKLWLRGVEASALEAHMPAFVQEVLEPRWNRVALARMDALRSAGVRIHLLTGAPEPVARAVGARWGMDAVVATRLEVAGGRYTGRIEGPHRFARGKREALLHLAHAEGLALEDSWGFADHGSDVTFLEAFGHPVAVDPDRRLRRIAERRRWEVLPAC